MKFIRITLLLIAACFLFSACKTTAPLDAYQGFSDQQIFNRAEANMQKHKYQQAVKDFEALDTLYPFGPYSQQGQLDIINAYYKNGDNDSAIAAADRYIRLYPRADNVDYAYYMKGIVSKGPRESWYERWLQAQASNRDISAQETAMQSFNTLIERFPNSKYAPEARAHITEIRNQIAQHELEIAQYYLHRKIYVAAANRASNLVDTYPGTAQVTPALQVMVQSYRALNEPVLAENAQRMLQNRTATTTAEAKK